MIPMFFVYIALGLGFASAWEVHDHRATVEKAQACVQQMFSDPDAYDPAAHFEIKSDSAPPFPDAVDWINDNLKDCMEGNIQ